MIHSTIVDTLCVNVPLERMLFQLQIELPPRNEFQREKCKKMNVITFVLLILVAVIRKRRLQRRRRQNSFDVYNKCWIFAGAIAGTCLLDE